VKEIAHYTSDPDATFPTSIILNINTRECRVKLTDTTLTLDERTFKPEVIDGQHRLGGLKASTFSPQFHLPVVLMFDLTEEEKAYVFSTINSNQQRVDASLIYDLFALSKHRSPFRTCHEIARALNSAKDSPYRGRLKMLGRRTRPEQSLSQGAFVAGLVNRITKV
jgi:DGQHR domain-containing protein